MSFKTHKKAIKMFMLFIFRLLLTVKLTPTTSFSSPVSTTISAGNGIRGLKSPMTSLSKSPSMSGLAVFSLSRLERLLISGVFDIPANMEVEDTLVGVIDTWGKGVWPNIEPATGGGGLFSKFFSSDWDAGGGTIPVPGGWNWGGSDIWKAWGLVFVQGSVMVIPVFAGGMTGCMLTGGGAGGSWTGWEMLPMLVITGGGCLTTGVATWNWNCGSCWPSLKGSPCPGEGW